MVEDNSRVFMKISANKTRQEVIDWLVGLEPTVESKIDSHVKQDYTNPTYKYKQMVTDLGNNEFSIAFKVYYTGTTGKNPKERKQKHDIVLDKIEKEIELDINSISGTILTTHLCYKDKPGVNK